MLSPIQPNKKKLLLLTIWISLIIPACRFYFKTSKDTFSIQQEPSYIERGKNLAFAVCAGCHYDPGVGRFIGRSLNDLPSIGGHLYSANLTHSARFGKPAQYTDAQLFYLLKTGIAKNGRFMPYMMKPMMADEDVYSIIAFLRSDNPAVAAYDTITGKTRINFIGKTGIRFLMGPQPYQKGIHRPDENEPITYGRYLVGIIGCYHCHSKKTTGLDFLEPEKTKGYLQGGIKLKDPAGNRLYGPNLTFDKETGIGNFSKRDFQRAVRDGVDPEGRKLSPPMDRFASLTDNQVNSIYAYLQSLKPVHHRVHGR